MTQKADEKGRKRIANWVHGSVVDQWQLYVRSAKIAAAEKIERTSGSLLLAKAMLEYMERHPVKRKGK